MKTLIPLLLLFLLVGCHKPKERTIITIGNQGSVNITNRVTLLEAEVQQLQWQLEDKTNENWDAILVIGAYAVFFTVMDAVRNVRRRDDL